MNFLEYYLGEEPFMVLLMFLILCLLGAMYFSLTKETSKVESLKKQLKSMEENINKELKNKCPPPVQCPDCVCEKDLHQCPQCPDCKCPDVDLSSIPQGSHKDHTHPAPKPHDPMECPTVSEIIQGIFPGRNTGMTSSGKYYPVMGGSEENMVMMPSYSVLSNKRNDALNSRQKNSMSTVSEMNNQIMGYDTNQNFSSEVTSEKSSPSPAASPTSAASQPASPSASQPASPAASPPASPAASPSPPASPPASPSTGASANAPEPSESSPSTTNAGNT